MSKILCETKDTNNLRIEVFWKTAMNEIEKYVIVRNCIPKFQDFLEIVQLEYISHIELNENYEIYMKPLYLSPIK